jgi:hypothetical protein
MPLIVFSPVPGTNRIVGLKTELVLTLLFSYNPYSAVACRQIFFNISNIGGIYYVCVNVLSLALREEQRLRVSENRVLRRIFGLKRDETTGEWRRLHSE